MFIIFVSKNNLVLVKCTSYKLSRGLPRWLSGKESTYQCRWYKRGWFDPWVGKIPWRRKWQHTPVFLPGEPRGQRSLAGYIVHGVAKSWAQLSDWARTLTKGNTSLAISDFLCEDSDLRLKYLSIQGEAGVIKCFCLSTGPSGLFCRAGVAVLPGPACPVALTTVHCVLPESAWDVKCLVTMSTLVFFLFK